MSTVSALTRRQLDARLRGAGLYIEAGAFTLRLQSPIASVAEAVTVLYADYPLVDDAPFADFHIRVVRPPNVRRWFRRQALFLFDGTATFEPLPFDQAFPLVEWGFNWAVSNRAHGYLMIHAAIVEKNGVAAILPAPPGSGKSTLCAALVHRGWRLLSDELTLIRPADGMALPMVRPISLKNASIDVIRRYVPGAVFSTPVHDTAKGTVAHLRAPAEAVARAREPARPAWIIYPKYTAGSATRLTPVAPARSFMALADNAFNYSMLGAEGFDTLARVIDSSASYDFVYSDLDEAIAAFDQLATDQLATDQLATDQRAADQP
jgi:HprK-related kinase A